ncbi:MAG: VWA domain-containing protein [Candidatus Acidiferrales bacterium]
MRRAPQGLLTVGATFALALALAAQAPAPDVTPAANTPTPPSTVTVAPGERLLLELQDSLNTRHNQSGDLAKFLVHREVVTGTQVAVPEGSTVQATLTKVRRPGRAGRAGQMVLHFDEVVLPDGTILPLQATLRRAGFTVYDKDKGGSKVKGENAGGKGKAVTVASGAAQGALIGVMMGGTKGAAYGGAIGAGIGVLEILLQKGPHLDLPQGMLFEVELTQALAIPEASAALFTQQAQAALTSNQSAPGVFSGWPGDDEEQKIPDFRDEPETESAAASQPGTADKAEPAIPDFEKAESAGATTETASPETATTVDPGGVGAPVVLPPAPPPPPLAGEAGSYKMKMDVRLVLVEAVVRDDRGQVLEGLKREDFRLFEDGTEQQIRHFSRDEMPLAVALVVDRSGSVAPYMPELRGAAYETLKNLKRGDEVALFAFAHNVERLEGLTTDRRRLAERIANIEAEGGTNIADALFAAANYLALAAPERRRAIILISDNEETTRPQVSEKRLIRLAHESEVVIYSVKTPGQQAPYTMRGPMWLGGLSSVKKITREAGGEVIDVDRVGSLKAALAAVITRLKTRYTLGYQPTNKAVDGGFRQVQVRLTERFGRPENDYNVFARRGYYAPTSTVASQSTASQ